MYQLTVLVRRVALQVSFEARSAQTQTCLHDLALGRTALALTS